jgi:hypothetical protein
MAHTPRPRDTERVVAIATVSTAFNAASIN